MCTANPFIDLAVFYGIFGSGFKNGFNSTKHGLTNQGRF